MRIRWYGQSAFCLSGREATVFIDPFADVDGLRGRGVKFDYPPIENAAADLVLVTHEHADHNGVGAVRGAPQVLRSAVGRLESPIGEVVAIASEHDDRAGTERGANTIFVFELERLRVAHFGDFGQRSLREEQAQAIGEVQLLFLPVGGGPTIDAEQAAAIVKRLAPRWVVPMHYRTERVSFLDGVDPFLKRVPAFDRLQQSSFDTHDLPSADYPFVIVPTAP